MSENEAVPCPCSSLTLKHRCPASQTHCVRHRRMPLPPSPWPLGPEPWLSRDWGIIAILCVSGQGGHCCCFYPLTKARPAGPAVSEFLWLGGGVPSLPFLPPTPEGHAESACLPEATALTPGLGQVKGSWVTQHWAEKAEDSLIGGQRAPFQISGYSSSMRSVG